MKALKVVPLAFYYYRIISPVRTEAIIQSLISGWVITHTYVNQPEDTNKAWFVEQVEGHKL